MLKAFVFLLLVLVSIAALTPCCSANACTDETTSAQHQDAGPEEGSCSLFACTGCPGVVGMEKTVQLPAASLPLPLQHVARPHGLAVQNVYRYFWQPPRAVWY